MRTSLLLLLLAAAAGCASAPSASPPALRAEALISDHRTIAADQLVPERNHTLFDVVRRRWPLILQPGLRGLPHTPGVRDVVGVYADGVFIGGVEALQTTMAQHVMRVRRLSPSEEFMRFGRSHPGGGLLLEWRLPRR